MQYAPDYLCPICQLALEHYGNTYRCANSHSFDIAKQGYVNLLSVQQKKSKNPGDNKIMINARRHFLEKQFYDDIIQPCVEFIQKYSDHKRNILDIGCGDGYFTVKVVTQLKYLQSYGLDISKEAIKVAARRDKHIHWLVASSKDIPLPDDYLSVVIKINAPANFDQLATKLMTNGIIVSITPGANHLDGLKRYLYSEAKSHKPEPSPKGFVLVEHKLIENRLHLESNEDIQNLFYMTPYAWNASNETRDTIAQLNHLETNIAFQINIWQKQQD